MKREFIFYFVDEPQFVTTASRAYVANILRAYRKQPRKFRTTHEAVKSGRRYVVTSSGATAVIEPN